MKQGSRRRCQGPRDPVSPCQAEPARAKPAVVASDGTAVDEETGVDSLVMPGVRVTVGWLAAASLTALGVATDWLATGSLTALRVTVGWLAAGSAHSAGSRDGLSRGRQGHDSELADRFLQFQGIQFPGSAAASAWFSNNWVR